MISRWIFYFYCATSFVTFIVFMSSSVIEKDWRALSKTFLAMVSTTFIFSIIYFFGELYSDFILTIFTLLITIFIIIVLLRVRSEGLKFIGEQTRIDERDALFHRFYILKPGTHNYENFYSENRALQEIDKKIQNIPDLGEPGSRSYHEINSMYQTSIFQLVGKIAQNLDDSKKRSQKIQMNPYEITRKIKGFAQYLGADLVGTTRLNQAYVYSHIGRGEGEWGNPIELNHTHAIAIGIEMRDDMIVHAPNGPVITESSHKYLETAKIAVILANFIRSLGYEARAHVDGNYRVMAIPIAVDAGLGELGRIGLLITPQFGPRVRLSIVTTTMPVLQDEPITFGVQDFCQICKKCARVCPSGSIAFADKSVYAGVEKWQSKQESCYRYWRLQGSDCALCIKVCPYSYPHTIAHELIRYLVQNNKFARRLIYLGDRLIFSHRAKYKIASPAWHNES